MHFGILDNCRFCKHTTDAYFSSDFVENDKIWVNDNIAGYAKQFVNDNIADYAKQFKDWIWQI